MFAAAREVTPLRLWKLSPWSLWINRYTYPLRLVLVWLGMKYTGWSNVP